jgi:hypothetical protein
MTDARQAAHHDAAIKVTKAVHTLAWFSIESCVLYLLYTGFAGRSGRRAAIAASVVAGECLVFAANGFRCPLSDVAERLGADHGSVTDIYLPRWFARHLPTLHVPLLLIAASLHGRNIRRHQKAGSISVEVIPNGSGYSAEAEPLARVKRAAG